jgi:uncharacterized membrane protein
MSYVPVSQHQRNFATLAWVAPLLFPIISQIILLIIAKDRPFIYRHAAQSLVLQIAAFGIGALLTILSGMFCLFAILAGLVTLAALGAHIYGAIRAFNGLTFEPPVTGPLAKSLFR